jgi:radical SAM superfamily enzyme YgiQ (UPF0313 family)
MLAAACLRHALQRHPENRHWNVLPTPAGAQDGLDNRGLVQALLDLEADALVVTLYLWNVERTLRLAAAMKRSRPGLRVLAGGPEAAPDHPLLERARAVDAVVSGEGEAVFPLLLRAMRDGRWPDLSAVATRRGGCLRWGRRAPPAASPAGFSPPAADPIYTPDAQGMAYLETNRGCPLRCAFCCYNLRRRGYSSLAPPAVAARLRTLRDRGAREVRLVDPTFNAHPRLDAVLAAMGRVNRDRRLAFFVEVRGDTITPALARRLAAAGVKEAEVGVQSTDPSVLRRIRRPCNLPAVEAGIRCLEEAGIRPTIDFMYGLPGQGTDDLTRSLDWLGRHPRAHPQFLPTLLLPGTALRADRRRLGLRGQRLPPYRVLATRTMPAAALAAVEAEAERRLGPFDAATGRFVGSRLPALFPCPVRVRLAPGAVASVPAAGRNRQALWILADSLYDCRRELLRLVRAAIRREPDILWQFVLVPAWEEPLDLLDQLLATLRSAPSHWLDRLVSPAGTRRLAARRVFLRLPRGIRFDSGWQREAEALLAATCH